MRHDPGAKFVARAVAVVTRDPAALEPVDVAQALWSSVELGYLPGPKARDALLGRVDAVAGRLDPQQLNMVAYALARMRKADAEAVADALVLKLARAQGAGRGAVCLSVCEGRL